MRRIVVTGANKGIGRAIVRAVLQQAEDTVAFLGSRDLERGVAARSELVSENSGWADRIEVVQLDVTDDASVAAAAEKVAAACGDAGLYGLVNNAGLGFGLRADPTETMNVNVLGVRRVSDAFVPLLGKAGRVVNITSASGPNFVSQCGAERQRFFVDSKIEWAAIQAAMDEYLAAGGQTEASALGFGDGHAYGMSKACANSYTMLLACSNPELVINACTPGYIATDLNLERARAAGEDPDELGMKPPEEGTRSTVHLLFGDVSSSGHYYGSDALRSPLHCYRSPGTPAYDGD